MAPARIPTLTFLTLLLLIITGPATASFAQGGSMRFSEWYPNSAHDFANVSAITCARTLHAFQSAYASSPSVPLVNLGVQDAAWPVFARCQAHASCILAHVSEMQKASLATAGVVLGLLPTLLAVLSPSLSELVLLSAQRPLLASVLSLGAPGVLQRRIFEYEDPFELVEPPGSARAGTRSAIVLGPWGGWRAAGVAAAEFVLGCACGVNTVALAIQTSNRSILSWGCTRTWPLIVWAFVPTLIHWIAAVGYRMTLDKSCAIPVSQRPPVVQQVQSPSTDAEAVKIDAKVAHVSSVCVSKGCGGHAEHKESSILQNMKAWLTREATSCASHSSAFNLRHPLEQSSPRANFGIFLNCIASFLSFFHVLYGTVVFSGILFVSNLDAIGTVVLRGLASAIVCRFLVLVEMGGMRGAILAANKQA